MAFASVTELGNYLQQAIPADKLASANLALDLATDLIKSDLNQQVDQATETITFYAPGSDVILLPELPVTAVASVTHDGDTLVLDDDYTWTRAGILTRVHSTFTKTTVVNYTHGYTTIPTTIKAVCLSVAGRFYDNPHGYDTKSGDNFSVSYFRSQGALTEAERRMLNPYRP